MVETTRGEIVLVSKILYNLTRPTISQVLLVAKDSRRKLFLIVLDFRIFAKDFQLTCKLEHKTLMAISNIASDCPIS